jgi:hypothetical protein
VRFSAAYALGYLRVDKALPHLERLAETDSTPVPGLWSVGKEAADAVASIKGLPHEARIPDPSGV